MLRIWALVSLELVLGLGVWLALNVLASWLSTSANYSLVLSLWQCFDHEQVKEVYLLAVRLVIELVVGAFPQLGLLSAEIILGPETDETVWPGWTVLDGNLRDEQPLWWICLD